jgi:transposase
MSKPLADADTFRRIEVITGTGRRRRWPAAVKAAIVAEALAEGAVVSEIARRHRVAASQVFTWRRQVQEQTLLAETPSFAPVVVEHQHPQGLPSAGLAACQAIEIEIDGARLRIPPNASREAIFAVIEAALGLPKRRR